MPHGGFRCGQVVRKGFENEGLCLANLCGLFVIALFLLAGAGHLWGQGAVGTLNGTVLDSAGAVVPGAAVVVTNMETRVENKTTTTSAGAYTLPYLPQGTYAIRVTMTGFRTATASNVILRAAQTLTHNITLEVGQVTENVTVSATPPLLEGGTAEMGQYINRKNSSPGRFSPVTASGRSSSSFSTACRERPGHLPGIDQRRAAVLARDPDRRYSARACGLVGWQQQRDESFARRHRRLQVADWRGRSRVQRRADRSGELQHQVRHQRIARYGILLPAKRSLQRREPRHDDFG